MKTIGKKILVILCCSIIVSALLGANLDVVLAKEVTNETENEISYLTVDLNEDFIDSESVAEMSESTASIEEELAQRDTDVLNELQKTIEKYEKLLDGETPESERIKIQELIGVTEELIGYYEAYNNPELLSSTYASPVLPNPINPNLAPAAYVSAAIAAFGSLGFDLAQELTQQSLLHRKGVYVPIYGNRVVSTKAFYKAVEETAMAGSIHFEHGGEKSADLFNTYIQDVYIALGRVSYERSYANSSKIIITDIYDYNDKEDRTDADIGIQGFVYDLMYHAQELGVISPVDVRIEVDASAYPRLQIVGDKVDSQWAIKVTNYKDEPVDVIYNEKMCFEDNAKTWTQLEDIKILRLNAKSSQIVYVQENAAATSFAFCYVDGDYRYITYANETYLSSKHNLNATLSKVGCFFYNDIGIVGKNTYTWYIKIKNTHDERKKLTYNKLMCFEGDAKNWTGLKDVTEWGYLEPEESCVIEIGQNYMATTIAVKLVGETESILIYANELNPNGKMEVSRIITAEHKYLKLVNKGKSGSSWKIEVTNPLSRPIKVQYNSKMCFEGDAKNWSGLNNILNLDLAPGETKSVYISTNAFATTVALSYEINGTRIISYANKLNKNGSIQVMYNYI